jgi:hypothetical protein
VFSPYGSRGDNCTVASQVVSTALSLCQLPQNSCAWRSHENHLAEGLRKPDVILVPVPLKLQSTVNFRNFQTYCEFKESDNVERVNSAKAQVTEMANIVTSMQINRRFFVGSYLCGSQLYTGLYARGCTLISANGLNISERPLDFITVILHLSAAYMNPVWNGFDSGIQDSGDTYLTLRWQSSSDSQDTLEIRLMRPIYIPLSMRGSSTRVWECLVISRDKEGKPDGWKTCILKDCWMNEDYLTDLEIHELLRTRRPKSFSEVSQPADEDVLGPEDAFSVFEDCVQVDGHWDHAQHLRGIPLVRASASPVCDTPTLDSDGRLVMMRLPDTTRNIMRRFFVGSLNWGDSLPEASELPGPSFEPRRHIQILYSTIAISIMWFSCRREFINGIMAAVIGKTCRRLADNGHG